jgi:hypothetical protein
MLIVRHSFLDAMPSPGSTSAVETHERGGLENSDSAQVGHGNDLAPAEGLMACVVLGLVLWIGILGIAWVVWMH